MSIETICEESVINHEARSLGWLCALNLHVLGQAQDGQMLTFGNKFCGSSERRGHQHHASQKKKWNKSLITVFSWSKHPSGGVVATTPAEGANVTSW